MAMFKYILKRIGLMFVTTFIIMTICFVLIKLLEPETPMMGAQAELEMARREALGYNKPIMVQYGIYLKNIITEGDWGTSWKVDYMESVGKVISSRIMPSLLLNIYSLLISMPIGIGLGIAAALMKNKWQDHFLSTIVMVFISVPSYVFAFVLQYSLGFKLGMFPVVLSSLHDAGGTAAAPPCLRG